MEPINELVDRIIDCNAVSVSVIEHGDCGLTKPQLRNIIMQAREDGAREGAEAMRKLLAAMVRAL